jgi:hypothetical protein
MTTDVLLRLLFAASVAYFGYQAWKRKDRRGVIDALLIGVSMAALLIPEAYPYVRYGVAGTALVVWMVRRVKFDVIDGTDKYARAMTLGIVAFALSIAPALYIGKPAPQWAKYLAIGGGITMMATLLWPFLWITRLLFHTLRLYRDLKHKRPPREADEKVLGIDLSPLRQPRD